MARLTAEQIIVLVIAAAFIVLFFLAILWPYVQKLIAGGAIEQAANIAPRYAQ